MNNDRSMGALILLVAVICVYLEVAEVFFGFVIGCCAVGVALTGGTWFFRPLAYLWMALTMPIALALSKAAIFLIYYVVVSPFFVLGKLSIEFAKSGGFTSVTPPNIDNKFFDQEF